MAINLLVPDGLLQLMCSWGAFTDTRDPPSYRRQWRGAIGALVLSTIALVLSTEQQDT